MGQRSPPSGLSRRAVLALLAASKTSMSASGPVAAEAEAAPGRSPETATLALTGDVMLGRGIDRILPYPSAPALYEPVMRSALDYVRLAERANGPVPRPVDFAYVWGEALDPLRRLADLRIVNLETSVTVSDAYSPKGINYRMNPRNVGCITAAGIDCCVLANNHVLDWGRDGLVETLATLAAAKVRVAGAGRNLDEAAAPAVFELAAGSRVVVYGFGSPTSGIPRDWAAGPATPGVSLIGDLSARSAAAIADHVQGQRRPGDILVASLHWGENWGYEVTPRFVAFAHALVDSAGFVVVHGHSSHHPQRIEIYKGRLILYGCGDFVNDYEGIGGYEEYRGDLTLLYLARLARATGELVALTLVPFQLYRMRLRHASLCDAKWLQRTLDRECGKAGTHVTLRPNGYLTLAPTI